jgi:hypothetical protein
MHIIIDTLNPTHIRVSLWVRIEGQPTLFHKICLQNYGEGSTNPYPYKITFANSLTQIEQVFIGKRNGKGPPTLINAYYH